MRRIAFDDVNGEEQDDVWLRLPPPFQDVLAFRNLRKREVGNETLVFRFHDPTDEDEYNAFEKWVEMPA